ncbi:AAA family ATPase [Amycolatopsis sp. WGS_07]|uniref:AAA family ATPase n=1 Tax=Amycolatopsis sp. WGS_07 TaxID=3076764 RepID=UPI003872D0E7
MRIVSARIRNYRSVVDSTSFTVEPGKTILVGINEAGKTALLRAMQTINAPTDTPEIDYLADYPRSMLNDIQTGKVNKSRVVVAEVTFGLDAEDRAALPVKCSVSGNAAITFFRYLDNTLRYRLRGFESAPTFESVRQDLTRMRAYVARREESEGALSLLDAMLAKADSESIEGAVAQTLAKCLSEVLPFVDEDDNREMNRWNRLDAASKVDETLRAAAKILIDRLPLLVYYSTYFTVRPRIDLESLAARQARGDIDGEYDFGNLCLLKLLGFTAKELSELAAGAPVKPVNYEVDPGARESHDAAVSAHQRNLDDRGYRLNSASVALTRDIRAVWGDDSMTLRIVADGQYLKVMVEDALGVEVELDQRSEGFRWLVSFFVVFRSQAQEDLKNAILLLDEPGLSLHALKQQEFRNTISLLGEHNQIIYTTHSPFMVGSNELDLVRIVDMESREAGTKVHTRLQVDDPKSIYPLQAALGYELAQGMFSQKRNLVCEGVTDMFYLNALNEAAGAVGGPVLKKDIAIIPAGTASKVVYFCTIYWGQKLAVAALLDSDNEGTRAAQQDSLVALLPTRAILRTGDFIDPTYKGAETEDLLRQTLGEVAKQLGWDSTTAIEAQPARPIVDILAAEHGKKTVSKWRLAKAFSGWLQANGFDALQAAEKTAWTSLCAAINKAL